MSASSSSAGIPSSTAVLRAVPRGYEIACWLPGMLAWLIFALSLACAMWAHIWDAERVDEHVRATAFVLVVVSAGGLVFSVARKRSELAFLRSALLVDAPVVRRGAPDNDDNVQIVVAHGLYEARTWTLASASASIESMQMLVARDGRHRAVLVEELDLAVDAERVIPGSFTASDWQFFALYLAPIFLALAAAFLHT